METMTGRFLEIVAPKIITESCCYSCGIDDYLPVCKITSLFQGMVNPQVNLVQ